MIRLLSVLSPPNPSPVPCLSTPLTSPVVKRLLRPAKEVQENTMTSPARSNRSEPPAKIEFVAF